MCEDVCACLPSGCVKSSIHCPKHSDAAHDVHSHLAGTPVVCRGYLPCAPAPYVNCCVWHVYVRHLLACFQPGAFCDGLKGLGYVSPPCFL